MPLRKIAVLSAFSAFLVTLPAQAETKPAVAVSIGTFNIDEEDDEDDATQYGIEYRGAAFENFYGIAPIVGIEANDDDAFWIYAGGRYEFKLSQNWSLTPHLAVAYYDEGDSLDLGSDIEFRSGLELSARITNNASAFLGVTHISNAGIDSRNPGVNSVMLGISFDL